MFNKILYLALAIALCPLIPLANAEQDTLDSVQSFNDAAELAHVTCQPHDFFKHVSSEEERQEVYEDSLSCIKQQVISIKPAYEQAYKALASNPQALPALEAYYQKWIDSMAALVPQVNEDEASYDVRKYALFNQTIQIWTNLASQSEI